MRLGLASLDPWDPWWRWVDPRRVLGLGPHATPPQPHCRRRIGWLARPHLLGAGRGLAAITRPARRRGQEISVVGYVDERDRRHHRPNPSSVKEAVWRVGRRGAMDGRTLWRTRRGNIGKVRCGIRRGGEPMNACNIS
jgi:hypothetical protein